MAPGVGALRSRSVMHNKSLLAVASLALSVLSAGCDAAASARNQPGAVPRPAASGAVAVVELFTSEGCSSCPAADDQLVEMTRDAAASKQPIYPLAFHVDYWNNLGWVDRFASAEFSERQRQYSQHFGANSIYTPQMVVNGVTQFVGSDRRAASAAVAAALREPAKVQITLDLKPAADSKSIDISYALDTLPAGSVINFAVVEDGLSTKVPRGENGGRTLRHEHVVRAFATSDAKAKSADPAKLKLPDGIDTTKATVLAYVQDRRSMRVLGATASPVPRLQVGRAADNP